MTEENEEKSKVAKTEENEEKSKVAKTEEKESFLKRLEDKTEELRQVEARIQSLVERNEELAARNLLGGKSDNAAQVEKPKQSEGLDYLKEIKNRMSTHG